MKSTRKRGKQSAAAQKYLQNKLLKNFKHRGTSRMWSFQSFHAANTLSEARHYTKLPVDWKQEERNSAWKCQSARVFLEKKQHNCGRKTNFFSKTSRWKTTFIVKMHLQHLRKYATSSQHCGGPAGVQPRDRPWFTADCLKHHIMRLKIWCDAQPKIQ